MKNIWPNDWEITELKNVASLTTGCYYQLSDYAAEDLNEVITIDKITESSVRLNAPKYMRITEREISKFRLRKGDIVLSHRNSAGQIGKSVIFDLDKTTIHTDKFIRIRCTEDYNIGFLAYVLKRSMEAGMFVDMARQNAHTLHVTLSQVRSLLVPDMSVSRQLEFMREVADYADEPWASFK